MSVQFGKWNFDGKPVDHNELDEIRPVLAPYGPDGEGLICKNNLAILYRAFHTTRESRRERQPYVLPSGSILTWDGRLDNREELIGRLGGEVKMDTTDPEIAGAAYERWNTDGFAALVGDWALSIWDPRQQSIVLAKDFVGTRHLYYCVEKNQVRWSTILDPLVLFVGHSFRLEEEYIAGWLAFFPATHLTPYVGIHSVPPACFVRLSQGGERTSRYWDFDSRKKIRYRTDAEYEDHFRQVFRESVRRRLRADQPILAELSGGMDSSSIVCVADQLMAEKRSYAQRLETISRFNDSDPNWNERPYFTKVEAKRSSQGFHVDVSLVSWHPRLNESMQFVATPASVGGSGDVAARVGECIVASNSRVLLSGIGGDEINGGVPTPIPELCDLLTSGALRDCLKQTAAWAIAKRQPWFHLLAEACSRFLPLKPFQPQASLHWFSWLQPGFEKRSRAVLAGYPRRLDFFGPWPSFQENVFVIDALRRQFSCSPLPADPPHEIRYPYLDRELVEFFLAIPRNQVVRPGERRSLLRRGLAGIVPTEILNRRRKAYVASLAPQLLDQWCNELAKPLLSEVLGIVNATKLRETVELAKRFQQIPLVPVLRTISLEYWLRSIEEIHSRHYSTIANDMSAQAV